MATSMQDVGRYVRRSTRARQSHAPKGTGKRKGQSVRTVAEYTEGWKGSKRKVIADPKKLASVAKARTTRNVRRDLLDLSKPVLDPEFDIKRRNTVKSIMGMVNKYISDPAIIGKVGQMDSEKLYRLLESNEYLVEIIYQYHIPPEEMYGGEKENDILFLISEYERVWGPIEYGEIGYGGHVPQYKQAKL